MPHGKLIRGTWYAQCTLTLQFIVCILNHAYKWDLFWFCQVFGDTKYLDAAKGCGEVLWSRGLLRKGYGICHGVSGNAYGMLALYNLTHDMKHLYRASKVIESVFSGGESYGLWGWWSWWRLWVTAIMVLVMVMSYCNGGIVKGCGLWR